VSWWRVQLSVNGKVESCTKLEAIIQESTGSRVFFVCASLRIDAEAQAYKRYKLQQKQAQRARRATNRAQGLCKCGRRPPAGRKQCDLCIARSKASKARAMARERGETLQPLPPKSMAIAETRAEREQEVRLEVLRKVQEEWQRSPNVRSFGVWLDKQIATAEKGKCYPESLPIS